MIKLNAKETKISIGKYAGTYRYVLSPMLYTTLPASKVIEEAVVRSGISKGTITAAYQAIGDRGTRCYHSRSWNHALRTSCRQCGESRGGGKPLDHQPPCTLHPVCRNQERARQDGCQHHLLRPQRQEGEDCERADQQGGRRKRRHR